MPKQTTCQITFTVSVLEAQLLAALAAALDCNNDLTAEMALDLLPEAIGTIRDNLAFCIPDGDSIQDAFRDRNWSSHGWSFMEEFILLS